MERFESREDLEKWTDVLFEWSDREIVRILSQFIDMIRNK